MEGTITTHIARIEHPGECPELHTSIVLVVLSGQRYLIATGSRHRLLDSLMDFRRGHAREAPQGIGLIGQGEDHRHGTGRETIMIALPAAAEEAVAATAVAQGGPMNRERSRPCQMSRRPAEVVIEAGAGGRAIDRRRRAPRRIGADIKPNFSTLLDRSYYMIGCYVDGE